MKNFLGILAVMFVFAGAAMAGFNATTDYSANQGFKSSTNYSITPIKQVLKMRDDQVAVVRGSIVKQLSDDKYLFKDKSGEMIVEIDYKYWNGLVVNEQNVLELTGKLDVDFNSVVLEVFSVIKIK